MMKSDQENERKKNSKEKGERERNALTTLNKRLVRTRKWNKLINERRKLRENVCTLPSSKFLLIYY